MQTGFPHLFMLNLSLTLKGTIFVNIFSDILAKP